MFEDIKESLGLSTSPEGGVFDFENGPVAEHVNAVYLAVNDLRAMSNSYEVETEIRKSVGAGWSERANVVGLASGVEVENSVGEDIVNMTYGDQLGGLRAPVDTKTILRQVEKLRQDTNEEDFAEEVTSETESPQVQITEGAEIIDFSEAQKRKALIIAAQESIDKAYSAQQNAA